MNLWIARDADGDLNLYFGKPYRNKINYWMTYEGGISVPEHLFPEIQWEDEEPTRFASANKEEGDLLGLIEYLRNTGAGKIKSLNAIENKIKQERVLTEEVEVRERKTKRTADDVIYNLTKYVTEMNQGEKDVYEVVHLLESELNKYYIPTRFVSDSKEDESSEVIQQSGESLSTEEIKQEINERVDSQIMDMNFDSIKPAHYQSGDVEVMDIFKTFLSNEEFKGFCKANMIKYILRADKKNGGEDYQKIQRYLDEILELERGEDE